MNRTVIVIHGVANRDRRAFESIVTRLAGDIGTDARIVPVYWGDLGAAVEGLSATIPDLGVRAPGPGDADASLGLALLAGGGAETRMEPAALVIDSFDEHAGTEIRATDIDEMRREIADTWPTLGNLSAVLDEDVLRALGRSLAQADDLSADVAVTDPAGGVEVRMQLPDPRRAVRQMLHGIDHVVGAVLGAAGGGLNTFLRRGVAPRIGEFLGDVLVYQRHRQRIHARVWDTIKEIDSSLGSKEHPVDLFGHSLGGVIGFDMAAASDPPLWVNTLLTFGSQSPFLHVLDPRALSLAAYAGAPVRLPSSVRRWTNLWEPLDPLAFIAARIFELDSGAPPDDRAVKHLAASGLWTHSAYWGAEELIQAAREALGIV